MAVKARCLNPKQTGYANYGGAGIEICDRWLSFENFLDDMGERPTRGHTIDRLDPKGNYEPGNCRWATWPEQHSHRRTSLQKFFDQLTVDDAEALLEFVRAKSGVNP